MRNYYMLHSIKLWMLAWMFVLLDFVYTEFVRKRSSTVSFVQISSTFMNETIINTKETNNKTNSHEIRKCTRQNGSNFSKFTPFCVFWRNFLLYLMDWRK